MVVVGCGFGGCGRLGMVVFEMRSATVVPAKDGGSRLNRVVLIGGFEEKAGENDFGLRTRRRMGLEVEMEMGRGGGACGCEVEAR